MNRKTVLAFLAVLAVVVWWGVRCVKRGNDFQLHFEAARLARMGQDIYTPPAEGPFVGIRLMRVPPLYACLLSPLTVLPHKAAAALWYLFKLGLTAYTWWLLWRWVSEAAPWTWKFAGWMLLVTGRFIIDDFQQGQVTLVVIEMAILGLFLKYRGKERAGAVWLGLATAMKMLPGIFVFYYVWKKEYRFAAWMVVATVAWTLLPVAWYGSEYPALMKHFVQDQMVGTVAMGAISGADNQSWQGMLVRLLGHYPTEVTPLPYANIVDIPFSAIKIITYAGDLLALSWLVWVIRREKGMLIGLSATFATMLFVSPNSGKSYFVALLLPYALLVHAWMTQPAWFKRAMPWFWASVALCTFSADGWITRGPSDIASAYSAMFWGLLALMGALHVMVKDKTVTA